MLLPLYYLNIKITILIYKFLPHTKLLIDISQIYIPGKALYGPAARPLPQHTVPIQIAIARTRALHNSTNHKCRAPDLLDSVSTASCDI